LQPTLPAQGVSHGTRLGWWADPGWTPGAQRAALSLSLLRWTGERKDNERLMGRDTDRERSFINHCHGQKTQLEEKLI